MSETFTTTKQVEANAKTRMDKVLADLSHSMASVRTGRANPSMLENVRVDYYGTPTPINQVGTVSVPEAGLITVAPWDSSLIGPIEKAIRAAELGLNPANDGKLIRIPIPALNEERRKELAKKLHGMAEDHRVALRNVRRDANDHVKKLMKDKLISEDDEKRSLDEIQKLTDATMKKLDEAAKTKEKEIMEIR
ncbi:MAG: ribosome recycling factor [Bryobacter sp.]|jgi:ribosome recycling factor|nr:ribosome recycling factor [Bryobacter sp. CoA8 C33]